MKSLTSYINEARKSSSNALTKFKEEFPVSIPSNAKFDNDKIIFSIKITSGILSKYRKFTDELFNTFGYNKDNLLNLGTETDISKEIYTDDIYGYVISKTTYWLNKKWQLEEIKTTSYDNLKENSSTFIITSLTPEQQEEADKRHAEIIKRKTELAEGDKHIKTIDELIKLINPNNDRYLIKYDGEKMICYGKLVIAKSGNKGMLTVDREDSETWIDKNGVTQTLVNRKVSWDENSEFLPDIYVDILKDGEYKWGKSMKIKVVSKEELDKIK